MYGNTKAAPVTNICVGMADSEMGVSEIGGSEWTDMVMVDATNYSWKADFQDVSKKLHLKM